MSDKQTVLDPSQYAFSANPNYEGTPTEYYDKNGQLVGYLANGNNVMSTSGLNFVNPDSTPNTSAINKHSLYQATDENGNLLYNPAADTQAGETPVYSTQDQGRGAVSQQLAGLIKMNAPSPGILQDPLFRNFALSAAAMGGAAAFAPALGEAGALGSVAQALPVEMGAAIPATELGALGLTDAQAAALMGTYGAEAGGGLTAAQALPYGKMGLSGLGLASQLAGLAGGQGGGQSGQGGGQGSGQGGNSNVSYNSSGPWNTPLSPHLATVGSASQRPITSGLEHLEMLEPSLENSFNKQQEAPKPSYFTYGSPAQTTFPTVVEPPAFKNGGAIQRFMDGGQPHVPEFITGVTGHYVKGGGTGQSDEIPAMLANSEYVFDADTVSALGDGSSDAGAKLLDKFRESVREHKRSAPVNKIPPKAAPLQYMKEALYNSGRK